MADGILTPCNVSRSWHWFRQVTAPCNVACSSEIMTVNSQVAAPCNVIRGSGTCHWIRPNVRHIGIILLVSISTISSQSTCHTCASLRKFIQIGPLRQKKRTSCRFSTWRISAILDFRGPIMGSLKSPCTTSYRSSVDTIALNCLVFEKNRVFAFCRQTDRQTNRWTAPLHEAAVAVASGGLIIRTAYWLRIQSLGPLAWETYTYSAEFSISRHV